MLDIHKDFDSVNWSFIFEVCKRIKFSLNLFQLDPDPSYLCLLCSQSKYTGISGVFSRVNQTLDKVIPCLPICL